MLPGIFNVSSNNQNNIEKKNNSSTTLLVTNMETQKGPYKDYSPFKGGLYGFHVSLGECNDAEVLVQGAGVLGGRARQLQGARGDGLRLRI